VLFTGFVKEVRPVVAESWLSVVPLRYGAGTRLKIIESMALGTPVVSTSKGAEGLAVTHGENILIANGSEEFAQAVIEAMKNSDLRRKLSDLGKKLVSERYNSEVMGRDLDSLMRKVVHNNGAVVRAQQA
jgi:glycosyltransferase involved in cell wall biosynthesis